MTGRAWVVTSASSGFRDGGRDAGLPPRRGAGRGRARPETRPPRVTFCNVERRGGNDAPPRGYPAAKGVPADGLRAARGGLLRERTPAGAARGAVAARRGRLRTPEMGCGWVHRRVLPDRRARFPRCPPPVRWRSSRPTDRSGKRARCQEMSGSWQAGAVSGRAAKRRCPRRRSEVFLGWRTGGVVGRIPRKADGITGVVRNRTGQLPAAAAKR